MESANLLKNSIVTLLIFSGVQSLAQSGTASTGDVGSVGLAGVDLAECATHVGNDVWLYASQTGDYTGFSSGGMPGLPGAPFKVQSGRVVVNNPDLIVSREKENGEDRYKYKVPIQPGVYEIRTLQVIKEKDGSLTLRRRDDLDTLKKVYGNAPGLVQSGMEVNYTTKNGNCRINQAAKIMNFNGKDGVKEVYVDKKYCDSLEQMMRESGKTKTAECVSLLDKAGKLYSDRQGELQKEGKMFSNVENGMIGSAVKVAMCSPREWQIRLQSIGMNVRYDDPVISIGPSSNGAKSSSNNSAK